VFSIAPGEGKTPLRIISDTNCEQLSFPKFFPKGGFGFNTKRKTNLTLRQYFNARLLSKDTRFSESTEYLFFAQYLVEAQQIQQNITIALRKCKQGGVLGQTLTDGMIKDRDFVFNITNYDEGYRVLRNVRGSPAAWQNMQYDCLAKLRQLGPYTFFMTFSVAGFKWNSIIKVIGQHYGEVLSDTDIDEMDYNTKCFWLRRNPVIAARHIDYIFQKMFNGVLLSYPHPVSQILHYDLKTEFQGRGRVHFHLATHNLDAPRLDQASNKEVVQFVDKYVSCSLPDEETQNDLHKLVTELNTHKHTKTCKKHGSECRFGFPRPPSPTTLIARPQQIDENDRMTVAEAKDIMKKVYNSMTDWNYLEPMTLDGVLKASGVSQKLYIDALKVSKSEYGYSIYIEPICLYCVCYIISLQS